MQSTFIYLTITLFSLILLKADKLDTIYITIDPAKVTKIKDKSKVLGINFPLWTPQKLIDNPKLQAWIKDINPKLIRIPGGSWSDEYYWNGNGVRISSGNQLTNFDLTKQKSDGTWEIDYSDYKPGFRVAGKERNISNFHGYIDVLKQHKIIQELDSNSFICVNAGSGTPQLAAEWVKWATVENTFSVPYCEIGNELNGEWELGHFLKNGKKMNGEYYSNLFLDYSKAIKNINPHIKVGGPASSSLNLDFCKELIMHAGEELDFVSFHTYPVTPSIKNNYAKFKVINQLKPAVKKIRSWINQYQPDRKDEIEIGISEWNMKLYEGPETVGLINTLWSTIWIGTLFQEEIDFAQQWDLCTLKKDGGHALFYHDNGLNPKPNSLYWSMWIWNKLMGDELIYSDVNHGPANMKNFILNERSFNGFNEFKKIKNNKKSNQLYSFATKDSKGVQIILINIDQKKSVKASLNIPNDYKEYYSEKYVFSELNYFWDIQNKIPQWSYAPSAENYDMNDEITIKPSSITVIRLSEDNLNTPKKNSPTVSDNINLEILISENCPIKKEVKGSVIAYRLLGGEKYPISQKSTGDFYFGIKNKTTKKKINFENGISNFSLNSKSTGDAKIKVNFNGVIKEKVLNFYEQTTKKRIIYTFDNSIDSWGARSSYNLSKSLNIKANESVAVCSIKNKLPKKDNDILFHFKDIDFIPKNNAEIIGFFGDIKISENFSCGDPNANIQIIAQSHTDHWMPLASIPLKKLRKWHQFDIQENDLNRQESLDQVYAIRIKVNSLKPITGKFYLDNLGFVSQN